MYIHDVKDDGKKTPNIVDPMGMACYNTPASTSTEHPQFFPPFGSFPQNFPPPYPMPPMMQMGPFCTPNSLKSEDSSELSFMSPSIPGGPIRNKHFGHMHNKEDSQKFDEVPGRLCLLSGSTKYKVTVNEVKRRIAAPETLHASLLNGMLRKAKAKDNGKNLRVALARYNIELPTGRRKTSVTTGFTALCEEEAVRLATQWNELCQREANPGIIGRSLTQQAFSSGRDKQTWMRDLQGFRNVMEQINLIYGAIPENPDDIDPKSEVEHAINRFSLLTHGFGHNAIKATNLFYLNIANEAMSQFQQPQHGYVQPMIQPFYNI